MTYKVSLSPHAVREYKKLEDPIKPCIQEGLEILKSHPLAGPKVKRLKGRLRDYYRYRVDDYRIIYTVSQKEHMVWVDYIQPRKDAYR